MGVKNVKVKDALGFLHGVLKSGIRVDGADSAIGRSIKRFERLRECPDVVVSKAKCLYLCHLTAICRETAAAVSAAARQYASQLLQCLIQHVHSIALSIVGLDAAIALQLYHQRRAFWSGPRLAAPLTLFFTAF